MATAAVATATHHWETKGAFDSAAIPGISLPLVEKDLVLSSETYNGLIPIEKQVKLQDSYAEHIKALLAIINKHGMGGLFGVHSLHRHDAVPEKMIRLEAAAPGIDGMNWTRATPITGELLTEEEIHATFFKVQDGTLIPFEFAKGPSPLKNHKISPQFIIEIAKYLFEHDLTDLISIEVKDFTKACAGDEKRTSELDVVWGTTESLTVVLPFSRMVYGVTNPVPTGWSVQDYSPAEGPGPGEHWNESTKSDGTKTHKVHVDSVEPITPKLLNDALVNLGYITKA
ncbi:hypothetical protein CTA2_7606 [Colletotrichum tanaceti]|uniref:Uncharacterized protein n=1 Tax=Colletotrichum tanaceti TaxID=1306861 RepID=A0A4V6DG32_9PEZI|nr:hypothetical protein CTA2_7606 [Colletotrichum tanaceti]TKW51386.1 hypothetical protein CTA1_2561 [Colletotrichum tanaceti]